MEKLELIARLLKNESISVEEAALLMQDKDSGRTIHTTQTPLHQRPMQPPNHPWEITCSV